MFCQVCNKKNATVHCTELKGGRKTEIHVCQDCAREKGVFLETGGGASSPILDLFGAAGKGGQGYADSVSCGFCGMRYSDFKSGGRMGCGTCYNVFRERIGEVIRRIHGQGKHAGKVPETPGEGHSRSLMIERHKNKLRTLVSEERFEEAARLRDIIRKLEG